MRNLYEIVYHTCRGLCNHARKVYNGKVTTDGGRAGLPPQQAIHAGFERAWGTILDSNLTTLIVGVALLAFGTGPVRGFAVVHCIGILTSMFSSIVGVRAIVNLWYGRKRKLQSISIGQIWKPKD